MTLDALAQQRPLRASLASFGSAAITLDNFPILLFATANLTTSPSLPSPICQLLRIPAFRTNMASDAIEVVSKMAPSQEDLTDEQMEEMLAQATTRLREKEEPKMFQTEAPQKFTFPKMDAGAIEKPYVVVKGNVAEADKSRLIDDKHRQAGTLIRKVEDPVTAKKLAAEVRSHQLPITQHHVYEEDIPIFPSSRVGAPFWCPSAKLRVHLFIVTLRHFHHIALLDTQLNVLLRLTL
jgi:hypothetical protein